MRMSENIRFDWENAQRVIGIFEYILAERDVANLVVPTPDKIIAFIRVQRFCAKHSEVLDVDQTRDRVIEIAKKFQLTLRAALRLYVELQRRHHEVIISIGQAKLVHAPNARKEITKISSSLVKVAEYSRKMLQRSKYLDANTTRIWIETAMIFWAKDKVKGTLREQRQSIRDLESQGFSYTPETISGTRAHFGEKELLERWLRTNILMSEIWQRAITDYALKDRPNRKLLVGETAMQSFAGFILPNMYTRFTGKKFGIVKGVSNTAKNVTGVLWVNMALAACKFSEYSPANIETLWRNAKRLRTKPRRKPRTKP